MDLGERIKYLRTSQGMTLEEVGDAVGVGKSTVRKWESGQIANMRRDKIALVAKALHVTPSYLMGWDEISDNLGSDTPAAKKLREVKSQLKSPMIDEMVNAMQRMTLKEQRKMVDVGKALFPERFKDDTKE